MRRLWFYLLVLSQIVPEGFCQLLPTDNLHKLLKSPIPLTDSVNCNRDCNAYEPPKLCYYRFIAENFMSNAVGCDTCLPNITTQFSYNCQCVYADGTERSVLSVNRIIPGPSIQACKNDMIVIDVTNKIEGQDLTIHWHGIYQKGSQYYDGVPFVTQCPILGGTTFRYQWIAEQAGTHFWHSHSGIQEINGIYGSIIIREPKSEDIHGSLYNTDLPEHVIVISEWMHELSEEHFPGRRFNGTGQTPDTFLINGLGLPNGGEVKTERFTIFRVKQGANHRFRLINAFASVCPSILTIESHRLKVIATDGENVNPVEVDSIISFTGERYDFIIEANKKPGIYWIQLEGLGECSDKQILQVAQLIYENSRMKTNRNRPTFTNKLPHKVTLNPFDNPCSKKRPDLICIDQLRSAKKVNPRIVKRHPDYKIFLSFLFRVMNATAMYRNKVYENYLVAPGGTIVQSLINGISFTSPTSPLLSQFSDVLENSFMCNIVDRKKCKDGCSCTHLLEFPLDSIIEIIVIDEAQVPTLSHPFHLHGQEFYVMGMKTFPPSEKKNLTIPYMIHLDQMGLLPRNFINPPGKDTIAVPRSGVIIVRFHATNPGFWLLHCHFNFHIVIGMDLVIHIGELSNLPPVPKGFPRCGDYTPPIFPKAHFHQDFC